MIIGKRRFVRPSFFFYLNHYIIVFVCLQWFSRFCLFFLYLFFFWFFFIKKKDARWFERPVVLILQLLYSPALRTGVVYQFLLRLCIVVNGLCLGRMVYRLVFRWVVYGLVFRRNRNGFCFTVTAAAVRCCCGIRECQQWVLLNFSFGIQFCTAWT